MGQGNTWNNKEEFQRKNHLLALLQHLQKGLQCSSVDRLKLRDQSSSLPMQVCFCEGAWLALLSSQTFSMQCPSLQKDAWDFRRAGTVPHESQRIGAGVAQILVMPSTPAGPMPWAQTA
jgi:hypothetical protein